MRAACHAEPMADGMRGKRGPGLTGADAAEQGPLGQGHNSTALALAGDRPCR